MGSDPWLLNTPGGVIDLRTGKSRRSKPDDYMTKITAVAPGGTCPIWERFIARITNRDVSLANFLQRVIGYSLTRADNRTCLVLLLRHRRKRQERVD